MANRAVLIVDAKADKALAELDKLKRKMEQTNRPAQNMNRTMDSFAARVASIAGPAALVGSAFAGWRNDLRESEMAVKRLTVDLRDAVMGAGLGNNLEEMRGFLSQRRGLRTQAADIQTLNAFMGAAPTASAEDAQSVISRLDLPSAVNPANADVMASMAGTLMMSGLDATTATDYSAGLSRALGRQAGPVSRNLGRIMQPLAGRVDPQQVMALVLAVARGDERVSSLAPVIAQMAESDPDLVARLISDPMGTSIPGIDAGRMAALRNQIPGAAADVAGFRGTIGRIPAMLGPQDTSQLAIAASERRLENLRSAPERMRNQQQVRFGQLQDQIDIQDRPALWRAFVEGADSITGGYLSSATPQIRTAMGQDLGSLMEMQLGEAIRESNRDANSSTGTGPLLQAVQRTAANTEQVANRPPIPNANEGMQ